MFQFMRKNDREELDDDDDDDDLEIESIPIAAVNRNTNSNSTTTNYIPNFGVPCFNWGGLDNGHRMKGEIPVGVADTSRPL